jgi:hypothetical protein
VFYFYLFCGASALELIVKLISIEDLKTMTVLIYIYIYRAVGLVMGLFRRLVGIKNTNLTGNSSSAILMSKIAPWKMEGLIRV